jgi:hypothetical protein
MNQISDFYKNVSILHWYLPYELSVNVNDNKN